MIDPLLLLVPSAVQILYNVTASKGIDYKAIMEDFGFNRTDEDVHDTLKDKDHFCKAARGLVLEKHMEVRRSKDSWAVMLNGNPLGYCAFGSQTSTLGVLFRSSVIACIQHHRLGQMLLCVEDPGRPVDDTVEKISSIVHDHLDRIEMLLRGYKLTLNVIGENSKRMLVCRESLVVLNAETLFLGVGGKAHWTLNSLNATLEADEFDSDWKFVGYWSNVVSKEVIVGSMVDDKLTFRRFSPLDHAPCRERVQEGPVKEAIRNGNLIPFRQRWAVKQSDEGFWL